MKPPPVESWLVCYVRCVACGHHWIAVLEVGTDLDRLECSVCGQPTGTVVSEQDWQTTRRKSEMLPEEISSS
jgi:transcription elongation factor Elf1